MLESSLLSGSVCEARSLIDSPARIGGETARWMDEEKWHGLGKKRCGGFRERSGLTEEKRRIWGEGARGWRGEAADGPKAPAFCFTSLFLVCFLRLFPNLWDSARRNSAGLLSKGE